MKPLLLVLSLILSQSVAAFGEDIAADALADIEWLLTPHRDVLLSKWPIHFETTFSNTLLHVRWVSRGELLARRSFWQHYQKHPDPKAGVDSSEDDEYLLLFDNSVCEYRQSVIAGGGLSSETVWRRCLPGAKGAEWYSRAVQLSESKDVLREPTDTSWCVILTYIRDGEARVKHFYLPSRIYLQTLVSGAFNVTEDCESWPAHDERIGRAKWMATKLKYDDKIWKTDE